MNSYKRDFNCTADAIITNALVFKSDESIQNVIELPRIYTENAAWDTGAQFTIISHRLVKALGLSPYGEGIVMGIGGDEKVSTYMIHVGLPNGYLVSNIQAYCSDIDDYDILIGMDIITLTDFVITNKEGKTTFLLRVPSEGCIEFHK